MKAARVHRFGDPLQIDDLPDPQPGPGEVTIEIAFVAVNPLDVWVTQGTVAGGSQSLPFVPGVEAVGVVDGRWYVVDAGNFGTTRDGLYRERAAVPRAALIPVPEGVDPAQAAAMPVTGRTAWWLVNEVAPVRETDRVIVLGASGGVGSLVVQLAKSRGAVVWGQTGNQEKAESITAAGADRAVVATADDLAAQLGELEPTIAFDALGGRYTRVLIDALGMGGRIGLYGTSSDPEATLDLRTLYRKGVSLLPGSVPPNRQRAAVEAALDELVEGHMKVAVDDVLPLDLAAEAHHRILTKAVSGKLLLQP
ncbi:quinone oxidoreductase family protein [Leifsonia sp. 2MCAF36]|uniref:quinone oxidoreductase family protein n=1 Tax=Leifsonia sp. 2MCAF36 TaxID=3232988 RepID=UPI003F9C283F